jgi:hypothetical protein
VNFLVDLQDRFSDAITFQISVNKVICLAFEFDAFSDAEASRVIQTTLNRIAHFLALVGLTPLEAQQNNSLFDILLNLKRPEHLEPLFVTGALGEMITFITISPESARRSLLELLSRVTSLGESVVNWLCENTKMVGMLEFLLRWRVSDNLSDECLHLLFSLAIGIIENSPMGRAIILASKLPDIIAERLPNAVFREQVEFLRLLVALLPFGDAAVLAKFDVTANIVDLIAGSDIEGVLAGLVFLRAVGEGAAVPDEFRERIAAVVVSGELFEALEELENDEDETVAEAATAVAELFGPPQE